MSTDNSTKEYLLEYMEDIPYLERKESSTEIELITGICWIVILVVALKVLSVYSLLKY